MTKNDGYYRVIHSYPIIILLNCNLMCYFEIMRTFHSRDMTFDQSCSYTTAFGSPAMLSAEESTEELERSEAWPVELRSLWNIFV